jgi:hypothetical protein
MSCVFFLNIQAELAPPEDEGIAWIGAEVTY